MLADARRAGLGLWWCADAVFQRAGASLAMRAAVSARCAEKKARTVLKDRTLKSFVAFHADLRPLIAPGTFTDYHVRDFLVSREITGGRTPVHVMGCPNTPGLDDPLSLAATLRVGGHSSGSSRAKAAKCTCPRRMAYGSVRSLMFALRSAMSVEWGLGTVEYDVISGSGNPANSIKVDGYLLQLQEEQAQRGVTVKKPVLIVSDKMRLLSHDLLKEVHYNEGLSLVDRTLLAQDRCRLLAAHASTNRHQQIAETLVAKLCYATTERKVVLAGYTWGKCLREGSTHISRFERLPGDSLLCVPSALEEYFSFARLLGWDMSTGYVFSPIILTAAVDRRGNGPASVDQLAKRFIGYLKRWHRYDGETLRGTRGGGAVVALTTDGLSSAAVKARAGWSRQSKMLELYAAPSLVQAVAGVPVHMLSEDEYKTIDEGPLRGADVRAALSL